MSTARALQESTLPRPAEATRWYSVLGVPVAVAADDPAAVDLVDEAYAAFRSAPASAPTNEGLALRLETTGDGTLLVRDSDGYERAWPDRAHAVGDLLSRFMLGLSPA